MNDSKAVAPPPKQDIQLPLVIRAKGKRLVVVSLITLGILGVVLVADILGSDRYRTAWAVFIVSLMVVSLAFYCLAWRAIRVTLTTEYLQARFPGYLIRTITIPPTDVRRAHVEKRVVLTTKFGGRTYRDFLVITDNTGKGGFALQISVYHSRDLWALLTALKQLAPHVKYDANIRRFLNLDE